jgi:hypothetical protein
MPHPAILGTLPGLLLRMATLFGHAERQGSLRPASRSASRPIADSKIVLTAVSWLLAEPLRVTSQA